MTTAPCNVSGVLAIDGIDLSNGPAFYTPDLTPLWGTEYDVRGKDRLVPGRVGVLPYRRRINVTTTNLNLIVSGHDAYDGAGRATAIAYLEANVAYLRDHLVVPPGTTTGVRSAVLTMPSGAVRSGPVHVLKMVLGNATAGWLPATLYLSVPGGVFT
jgi:hypothetical protein